VTTIGCTGHQTLSRFTQDAVRSALLVIFGRYDSAGITGLSNLAAGADQLFARSVLSVGGRLRVIIPCANYETTFENARDHSEYENLLEAAESRVRLDYERPSEEAFMAGGRAVVDRCDILLAVWDGKPAGGLGGTADVVAYARENGRSVEVIWPEGASRI
jgi:hypothetical protein